METRSGAKALGTNEDETMIKQHTKAHEIAEKLTALLKEAQEAGVAVGFASDRDDEHTWQAGVVLEGSTITETGDPLVLLCDDGCWSSADEITWAD